MDKATALLIFNTLVKLMGFGLILFYYMRPAIEGKDGELGRDDLRVFQENGYFLLTAYVVIVQAATLDGYVIIGLVAFVSGKSAFQSYLDKRP